MKYLYKNCEKEIFVQKSRSFSKLLIQKYVRYSWYVGLINQFKICWNNDTINTIHTVETCAFIYLFLNLNYPFAGFWYLRFTCLPCIPLSPSKSIWCSDSQPVDKFKLNTIENQNVYFWHQNSYTLHEFLSVTFFLFTIYLASQTCVSLVDDQLRLRTQEIEIQI